MRGVGSRYARFEQSPPYITLWHRSREPCAPSGGKPSGEWGNPKLVLSDEEMKLEEDKVLKRSLDTSAGSNTEVDEYVCDIPLLLLMFGGCIAEG